MRPGRVASASFAVVAAILAASAAACSAATPPIAKPARGASQPVLAAPAPISPARYVLTERAGASFDDGTRDSDVPRVEPAIVSGRRVRVDAGIVIASVTGPEDLDGFRSLPARLGGGFLIWSSGRTYRASDFLGELTPIADVSASSGARAWIGNAVLLRTERGILEVDLATLAARPFLPGRGIADALAASASHAVRLDVLGRAAATTDAGQTWIDLMHTRGLVAGSVRQAPSGELELVSISGQPELRLRPGGEVEPIVPPTPFVRRSYSYSPYSSPSSADEGRGDVQTSKSLAPDLVAHVAIAGALLPGARILVARDQGLRLLSARTARPLADAGLLGVEARYTSCQPLRGAGEVLLACTHARGGHVLVVEDDLATPKLEATFPDAAGFIADDRGRLAFTGRCGRQPPSPDDFGAPPPAPQPASDEDPSYGMMHRYGAYGRRYPSHDREPTTEETAEPERRPAEDARLCVRLDAAQWVERRLQGQSARDVYRWVLGDDGVAIALVIPGIGPEEEDDKKKTATPAPAPSSASTQKDVVRVIRLDPGDAALAGGKWPAVPPPMKETPWRSVDLDFWEARDGSIRGWVHLPAEEEGAGGASTEPPADAAKPSPVSSQRGGRTAGARIAPDGKVKVFPLPSKVVRVVTGGRFGFAMAKDDDRREYFETTDGGTTWTSVEGPPIGELEEPVDATAAFGCSEIGCTLGGGVVRLGWGGPKPAERKDPDEAAPPGATFKAPSPPVLVCRMDREATKWPPDPPARPAAKAAPPPSRPSAPPAPPVPAKPGARPARPAASVPATPPEPISIRTRSSAPLGVLKDRSWSADMIVPFQPGAPIRRMSAPRIALDKPVGTTVPVLSQRGVDLLLVFDRKRMRLGAGAPALLPFDYTGRISAAVETPLAGGTGADLLAIDADRGIVLLMRGDAARPVLRLPRVSDPARTRLTLALRPAGLAIVGYSTSSGDVFAGDLDLAKAEIAPALPLASLRTLTDGGLPACAGVLAGASPAAGAPAAAGRSTYRFLAEVPVAVRVTAKGGSVLHSEGSVPALLLIAASPDKLCVEGVELRGSGRGLDISAWLAARPSAVARAPVPGDPSRPAIEHLSCILEPAEQRVVASPR